MLLNLINTKTFMSGHVRIEILNLLCALKKSCFRNRRDCVISSISSYEILIIAAPKGLINKSNILL